MQPVIMDDIRNRMYYQRPDAKAIEDHKAVQDAAVAFCEVVLAHCPQGREMDLALTKAEEARMWANSAIAHTGKGA